MSKPGKKWRWHKKSRTLVFNSHFHYGMDSYITWNRGKNIKAIKTLPNIPKKPYTKLIVYHRYFGEVEGYTSTIR